MQVSLSGKPASKEQIKEHNNRDTKPAKVAKHSPAEKQTPTSKKNHSTTEKNQVDNATAINNGQNTFPTQPQIIAYIKHELHHYFYYPEIARRRGWYGHVVITLEIGAAGKIQNVTLKRSSGYSILDNAAISSVNKIGLIPFIKQNGYTGSHTIQLPIEYQLKG